MTRDELYTLRSGETVLGGKKVGNRKFIIQADVCYSKKEELILNAHSAEDCEDKLNKLMESKAKQQGAKLDTIFVDFCMSVDEFEGELGNG